MQTIGLVAPVALPAVAGLIGWMLGRIGVRFGGYVCASGGWLALAALLAAWLPSRAASEASAGALGAGVQLGLRLDSVSFAYELIVLVPAAALLTFQPRPADRTALAGAALSASLLAIAASGLALTALAWAAAVGLLAVALLEEREAGGRQLGLTLAAAVLALTWGTVLVQNSNGTTIYAAIPISGLTVPVFVLLSTAAVLTSAAVPWRSWAADSSRPSMQATGLAVAALVPLGFYLLTRMYSVGAGRYPSIWLNFALAALGTLTALAAAARAQAAPDRPAYLAEVMPGLGGLAIMALGLGTPVGVTAAVLTIAAASLLAAALHLLPSHGGAPLLFALAVAAGAPPSLVFAARLLDIQAALESGEVPAFLALAAAVAWLWSLAAAARATRLPDLRGSEPGEGAALAAVGITAFCLAAGAAAGVLATWVAMPAAAEVMTFPRSALTGGSLALVTASGAWPAVTLAGPLLVAAAVAVVAFRGGESRLSAGAQPAPPAFFSLAAAAVPGRLLGRVGTLRLSAEYRSLLDLPALEAAVRKGDTWFWVAIVVVLAILLAR